MKQKSVHSPASPYLLDKRLLLRVKEFAELTGTPLASVYALVAAGKIDVVRLGSSIRIRASALRELVA